MLSVASCYRNRDKLWPGGPHWPYADFTFTNLKGKIFPQLYLEFVLDVSENQGRIGKHLAIFMCVRARVSILDPVFLRPDPKWRGKLEQTVTDDCHFSLCLCNDVPVEFILV